jgi:hypothetical protein
MLEETLLDPAKLVHQLASKMRAANLAWTQSKAWTMTLKESLRILLENQGSNISEVLYSCRESNKHEFLLDVVVWDRSGGEGVALAVESEWSQSVEEVAEDFWKLLVVKAPVKLMIFACNKRPRKFSQDAVWEGLSECLKQYRDHRKNERYVFMDYAPPPGRRAWWIEIPADGRLNEVPQRNWIEFE